MLCKLTHTKKKAYKKKHTQKKTHPKDKKIKKRSQHQAYRQRNKNQEIK